MGWAILAGTAIAGVTTAILKYKKHQEEVAEENRKAAQEAVQETDSYIKSLDGLKEKYNEIIDTTENASERVKKLNDFKQELIDTYGFEKKQVDKLNQSREYGNKLLDEEIEKQNRNKRNEYYAQNEDAINEAIKAMETTVPIKVRGGGYSGISNEIASMFSKISFEGGSTNAGSKHVYEIEADNIVEEYEKLNSIIVALQKKDLNLDEQSLYNALVEKSKEIKAVIDGNKDIYDKYYEYQAQDLLSDYIKSVGDATDLTGTKLSKWKEGLIATADGNQVLEEKLQSLIDKTYQFDEAVSNVSSNKLDVDSIKSSLSEYDETVKDFLSIKSKLESAFKEQNENGFISEDTAFELRENGYGSAVKKEGDNYKVLTSEINAVTKARNEDTVSKLENAKADALANKQMLQSIIDTYKHDIEITGSISYYQPLINEKQEAVDALDDVINGIDMYIAMLGGSDSATSKFADTISDITAKVNEFSESFDKLSSVQSSIKTAMTEMDKYGRLSGDTIKKLIDAGYRNALSYNEQTGETILLKNAVDELSKAQIRNKQIEIQKSIDDTTKALKEAEKEYCEIAIHMNSIANVQYYQAMYTAAKNNVEELKKLKADQENDLMMYSSLNFSFDDGDAEDKTKDIVEKAKSELDHLRAMDVITEEEYYKRLTDLINKYYKDNEEYLDEYRKYEEEIYKYLKQQKLDAIDEEIDRLKTVNKEKQEEIDLEKKRQALENAKKQKNVKVFDSERGWIHETNREEVQKAQEDYDKAVTDKKVSDLQSVRKAIEKGVNVLHSDNEDTDIQSQVDNIQPILKNEKVINSVEELLNLFNIPYDASKFDNTWDEMLKDWSNPNKIFQSTFDNIINKTINNVNQNIKNQKAININIDKVVADNPQRFAEQMKKVMSDNFEGFYETYTDKFGKELKMWRMNHGYDN